MGIIQYFSYHCFSSIFYHGIRVFLFLILNIVSFLLSILYSFFPLNLLRIVSLSHHSFLEMVNSTSGDTQTQQNVTGDAGSFHLGNNNQPGISIVTEPLTGKNYLI